MTEPSTLKDRIRQIRGDEPQSHFANSIAVHKETLSRWERGETKPDVEALQRICSLYGVNPAWLLLGEGPMRLEDSEVREASYAKLARQERPSAKSEVVLPESPPFDPGRFDLVPLAEAHLEAGGGAVVLSESTDKWLAFRKDWLKAYTSNHKQVVLMPVRGDSMEPTLRTGDVVMVDFGRRRIYDGGIYALGERDLIMVKRLFVLPDGRLRISSDNPDPKYEAYEMPHSMVRILGQVIWFARELI